jgi:hypothetical protein
MAGHMRKCGPHREGWKAEAGDAQPFRSQTLP